MEDKTNGISTHLKSFQGYHLAAIRTATYPKANGNVYDLMYPALGLVGEAGEVANKIKKILRDNGGIITNDVRMAVLDELGDTLWYINALASDLGSSLEEVAARNVEKLRSRQERNAISGSGDTR